MPGAHSATQCACCRAVVVDNNMQRREWRHKLLNGILLNTGNPAGEASKCLHHDKRRLR